MAGKRPGTRKPHRAPGDALFRSRDRREGPAGCATGERSATTRRTADPAAGAELPRRRRPVFESDLILQALEITQGNKNRAAQLIRMNRTTMLEKMKKKGVKFRWRVRAIQERQMGRPAQGPNPEAELASLRNGAIKRRPEIRRTPGGRAEPANGRAGSRPSGAAPANR